MEYPPVHPKPVMNTLSFKMPLCDGGTEKTELEVSHCYLRMCVVCVFRICETFEKRKHWGQYKICTFCDSRMVVSVLLGGSNTVEIRAQIIVHYNEVYNSVPSLAPSLPQDSYLQTCLLSRGNDTTEQVQLLMKQFAVSL